MRKVTINGLLAHKLRLALTALAIVLGVTFVTGTLILGDTLNRTFNTLIGTAYEHVNFQIRERRRSTTPRPRSTALKTVNRFRSGLLQMSARCRESPTSTEPSTATRSS